MVDKWCMSRHRVIDALLPLYTSAFDPSDLITGASNGPIGSRKPRF